MRHFGIIEMGGSAGPHFSFILSKILANHRAREVLFTCVPYVKSFYRPLKEVATDWPKLCGNEVEKDTDVKASKKENSRSAWPERVQEVSTG